jgi:hypothetical protein
MWGARSCWFHHPPRYPCRRTSACASLCAYPSSGARGAGLSARPPKARRSATPSTLRQVTPPLCLPPHFSTHRFGRGAGLFGYFSHFDCGGCPLAPLGDLTFSDLFGARHGAGLGGLERSHRPFRRLAIAEIGRYGLPTALCLAWSDAVDGARRMGPAVPRRTVNPQAARSIGCRRRWRLIGAFRMPTLAISRRRAVRSAGARVKVQLSARLELVAYG